MKKVFQIVPTCSYNITQPLYPLSEKMMLFKILKISTFTLILMIFLSPAAQLVNAQENETIPAGGVNSTIIIPPFNENITLTNTTLPSTNSTGQDYNGTTTDDEPIDHYILAMIKEQAQNSSRMLQMFGNGAYSPDIMNGLMHAQQAMDQAQAFEENNTRAAAQQYLRAMKQFRNTLRNYLKDNPNLSLTFEAGIANGTASDDINGTATDEEITSAKIQLINQFEERFRKQIEAMIQNIENVTDTMSPQDAYKAQQALIKTEQKLLRIQERIQSGQYDDALDELDNATDTLDEDLGELDDPNTTQMLRAMNQLEAKIQKMEQRVARKAAWGENTDEDNAILAGLRGNKNSALNEFKGNNGKGNGQETGKPDKDKSNKN